jgi:hypothetical protein
MSSKWGFGTFGRDCAICHQPKPQRHWSRVAACGRACGVIWQRERLAANRPDSLAAKGVARLPPLKAYAMGYQAGYARARYRYAMRQVA